MEGYQTIIIDCKEEFVDGGNYISCPLVCEYPSRHNLIFCQDMDKKIIHFEEIGIIFTYPLSVEARIKFNNSDGFSCTDLWKCIYEGYSFIYKIEKDFLNRGGGEGPYGIWGHVISDLFLEAIYVKNNLVRLGIGS